MVYLGYKITDVIHISNKKLYPIFGDLPGSENVLNFTWQVFLFYPGRAIWYNMESILQSVKLLVSLNWKSERRFMRKMYISGKKVCQFSGIWKWYEWLLLLNPVLLIPTLSCPSWLHGHRNCIHWKIPDIGLESTWLIP